MTNLAWRQAPIFAARGLNGIFYKIYPVPNSATTMFAASITQIDENGNPVSLALGEPAESIDRLKTLCQEHLIKSLSEQ